MKPFLRTFESSSRLRVNFAKSSLIGANVSDDFLALGAKFLNCKCGALPFKYLGLPVGANPRRVSTLDHMLQVTRGRFIAGGSIGLSTYVRG